MENIAIQVRGPIEDDLTDRAALGAVIWTGALVVALEVGIVEVVGVVPGVADVRVVALEVGLVELVGVDPGVADVRVEVEVDAGDSWAVERTVTTGVEEAVTDVGVIITFVVTGMGCTVTVSTLVVSSTSGRGVAVVQKAMNVANSCER